MDNKIKLLYVDDEYINLQLFEVLFSEQYEVFIASNAMQGFTILDKQPDILIIISDMKMPGMNGIEFITKAKEKYPIKKYYILTGFDITTEIKASLENGLIQNYFKKPFNLEEIKSGIELVVK